MELDWDQNNIQGTAGLFCSWAMQLFIWPLGHCPAWKIHFLSNVLKEFLFSQQNVMDNFSYMSGSFDVASTFTQLSQMAQWDTRIEFSTRINFSLLYYRQFFFYSNPSVINCFITNELSTTSEITEYRFKKKILDSDQFAKESQTDLWTLLSNSLN